MADVLGAADGGAGNLEQGGVPAAPGPARPVGSPPPHVPIDNEFILYTLVWQAANAAVQHQSLRREAREVLTAAGSDKFEVAMMLAGKLHAAALEKGASALWQFIVGMHPDAKVGMAFASNILTFLDQRASAEWLANELGHIA